jgi:hypothetical protein
MIQPRVVIMIENENERDVVLLSPGYGRTSFAVAILWTLYRPNRVAKLVTQHDNSTLLLSKTKTGISLLVLTYFPGNTVVKSSIRILVVSEDAQKEYDRSSTYSGVSEIVSD